jgi:hypothetical protein
MDDHVSPLTIKIMLAVYCSPKPEEMVGEAWFSPAANEVRSWLKVHELIADDLGATDKGKKWVEMICSTPFPVHEWIDPRLFGASK